jgi:hypothetical protein
MSAIRAQVYCHKEPNHFRPEGYLYNWYYEVINTETGNVLASDNTGDGYGMLAAAMRDLDAIAHCAKLGILKKSRGW